MKLEGNEMTYDVIRSNKLRNWKIYFDWKKNLVLLVNSYVSHDIKICHSVFLLHNSLPRIQKLCLKFTETVQSHLQ